MQPARKVLVIGVDVASLPRQRHRKHVRALGGSVSVKAHLVARCPCLDPPVFDIAVTGHQCRGRQPDDLVTEADDDAGDLTTQRAHFQQPARERHGHVGAAEIVRLHHHHRRGKPAPQLRSQ